LTSPVVIRFDEAITEIHAISVRIKAITVIQIVKHRLGHPVNAHIMSITSEIRKNAEITMKRVTHLAE